MSAKKIAVVTGGSRGLGRDMAVNLAKKGFDLVITYHSNAQAAQSVVQEIADLGQQARAFPLDAGDVKSFSNFVAALKDYLEAGYGEAKFDFLVNNAGSGLYGSVADTTEEIFDAMMNVHLKGVFFLTQQLLPLLRDGGRIINISSGLTRVTFPNVAAYASMKGAIETFTRCLAKELGSRKITANIVAPGAIATDFGGGANKNSEEKRRTIAGITALGRIGEPEDIGGVVAFLCTPDAGWVNGQRIELSGGAVL